MFAVSAAAFTALAYVSTHVVFSNYLQLVRLNSEAAELTIFCGALVGASLGFLWWNCYPAEIFMGDVGSLGLGGALGTVALLIKQEILFVVVGGVFVDGSGVGDHPGRLVQDDRPSRLQDGAAPSSLRTDWLERAEGHHPVRDPRDHLCLVQSDDVEAQMTADLRFSVRGKRVTVVGAARSGVAAAELARAAGRVGHAHATCAHIWTRRIGCAQAGVELELGGHVRRRCSRADLIVTSPGVPYRHPLLEAARQAGVPVIGELELASRWLRGRIVAITGTKGKSTTTTLTGRMLEAGGHRVLVGGNIGHALSAQVDESTEDTIHVVEASSFQLEATDTFHPWIAVLLNFSPDHLDRHATVDEYAAAKTTDFCAADRRRLGGAQRRRSGDAGDGASTRRHDGCCFRCTGR